MQFKLLDLFCGAGGASKGYSLAGFDVTGIDNRPQKRYPFRFRQADALEFLAEHWREFDAIHASPPCQAHTKLKYLHGKSYACVIEPLRRLLDESGKPSIIENVPGSTLGFSIFLCGGMFPGLRVYRHRRFESSFLIWQPDHPPHRIPAGEPGTKGGLRLRQHYDRGGFITIAGHVGTYCGDAMGIDWMTRLELSQAIPPAYTEYIGRNLMRVLTSRAHREMS
jgi:DNA (cytosine-5)-methyltransferase 1